VRFAATIGSNCELIHSHDERSPRSGIACTKTASSLSFTLRALAQDSGGRAFSPDDATQLGGIYETIAAEIANHYVLAYVPSTSHVDGSFRHVSVRVGSRGDAQARTRRGYYAAPERR